MGCELIIKPASLPAQFSIEKPAEGDMIEKVSSRLRKGKVGKRVSSPVLPLLTAGILIGINEVIFAISVSSLIFSGELASNLAQGIGITLVTAIVTLISISLFSSIPGVIGSLQDSPAVILALIAVALVGSASNLSAENVLNTLLVIIPLSTLLTGAVFLGLGFFKLGGLVRFFPFPVVGGFLAGTGWLLVQGSFGAMTDYQLTWANITTLVQPNALVMWVPGFVFAFILIFGMKRYRHYLTMPIILILAIVVFYLGLFMAGISIEQAMLQGLLLGGTQGEIVWQPLRLNNFLAADWASILGQAGNISIILMLSLLSLLLNTSALELSIKKDVDFDRELRAAGAANLLSGLGGGMVGYHTLSASMLGFRMGARSRTVGVLAGLFCGLILFTGSSWLAFFPKAILGGLLLYLGLEFLDEWVARGWRKLPPLDYAVVIGILLVIAVTDFLIGVAVGLGATLILFVIKYSQIRIVRHSLSGVELHSNVERTDLQRRALKELGSQVYILELQGFIFFGTANSLLAQIKERLLDDQLAAVRFIQLDFGRVSGLDSSAVFSFIKCRQLAEAHEVTLVLSNLSDRMSRQLQVGGLFEDGGTLRIFPDLDRGLEWGEEQLLDQVGLRERPVPPMLHERLVEAGFKDEDACKLMAYLERVEIAAGEYLIYQGDESNDIYLIECGQLSIYLELEDENHLRLQTTGSRTVMGEIGLYLGTARTASVIADEPSVAYRLSKTVLAEMREKAPYLAATFHEFAARQLAERLVDTTQLVSTLSK
jgi:SulP family sulfate permease